MGSPSVVTAFRIFKSSDQIRSTASVSFRWYGNGLVSTMLLFYILTCYISLASARADLTRKEFCFVACQQILRGVRFNGTNPKTGDLWPPCGNELEYSSLYLCSRLFCTDEERQRGIESANEDCRINSNATALPYEIVGRFTDEGIEKLHHLEAGEMSRMGPRTYNEVIVPSDKLYGLAWGTLVSFHIYFASTVLQLAYLISRMLRFLNMEFILYMASLCIIFGS